ncbi:dihydrofolate reductase [Necator americanus]|uniref:dihydrofolate reductase n=1 Tax=Necator americanus TaxID=51031 RepID=W2TJF1_NECAM|nr:dihydrofolate reductase [Necator americanus]ETN81276.1 dihydrofolate reductase [Necator americanus]
MTKQTKAIPRMGVIVAVDSKFGIGKNGTLPWTLRKDMKFFAECTSTTVDPTKTNAVIMGRKCWESIPEKFRPLKNRLNIVISRTLPNRREKDLIVTDDFDGILKELMSGELSERVEKVWNIGGAEIYKLGLESGLVSELVITKIQKDVGADVFLSGIDWENFEEDESARSEPMTENGTEFTFHRYRCVK